MLLEEADLEHGLEHAVSSYYKANPEESSVLILLLNYASNDSLDEDLIETDEPLQAKTTLTPFVQPPPTRMLPTIYFFLSFDRERISHCDVLTGLHLYWSLMMSTPRKRVRTPVTLPPAIKVAISDEIDAPPRKRAKLSPPLTTLSSLPPLLPLPSPSCKRSMSHSPPLLPLQSSPPSDILRKKSEARRWTFLILTFRIWTDQEGETSTCEIGESSTAHVLAVTGELVRHTVPLLVARLTCHEGLIEDIHDHLREVKFAACTLLDDALTWWNSYVKTIGLDGTDIVGYTRHFQELALLFPFMVTLECKMIERYIWGLIESIHGIVTSSKLTRIREAICIAHDLMDQRVRARAARNDRDYRTLTPATVQRPPTNNQRTLRTCFECGVQGHYRNACPTLKNQNHGNQGSNRGNRGAPGRAFVLSERQAAQDPNVVTGTFLLNNRYAVVLFNSGADRSFVSAEFSPLINIEPTTLDVKYNIELANEKLIGADTIILVFHEDLPRLSSVRQVEFQIELELGAAPAEFLALGSFDFVCQEEGWILQNVHSLS
ncbi:reverse transcriptase domain-containing protein [Tanacetum coccineum]